MSKDKSEKDFWKFIVFGSFLWWVVLSILFPERHFVAMLIAGTSIHLGLVYSVAFARRVS